MNQSTLGMDTDLHPQSRATFTGPVAFLLDLQTQEEAGAGTGIGHEIFSTQPALLTDTSPAEGMEHIAAERAQLHLDICPLSGGRSLPPVRKIQEVEEPREEMRYPHMHPAPHFLQ